MVLLQIMALNEGVVRMICMHTLCLLAANQCKTNLKTLFLSLMICFILVIT